MPHVATETEAFTASWIESLDPEGLATPRVRIVYSPEARALAEQTLQVFDEAEMEVVVCGEMPAALLRQPAVLVLTTAEPAGVEALLRQFAQLEGDPSLGGRVYALVVRGEVMAAARARRRLADALEDLGLVDASEQQRVRHFFGDEDGMPVGGACWFADDPDRERALQAARDIVAALEEARAGWLDGPDPLLARPRPGA